LRLLVNKEHENHELSSYILLEGLQSPELSSPSINMYDEVIEKYPVGDGRLLKVTSVLDEYNSQNYNGDDNDGDDNDNYWDY